MRHRARRWHCWTGIPSAAFCTPFGVGHPASRTGYEEAPQWSLSGPSVSQKTSVSVARKWNKVLWKWINAASIQSFRNSFQVGKKKKLPCLLPDLLTCEDGGSTKQWWENNPGLSLCDVSCQALCYHCYSPQLLGRFYKTCSLNKIFLQNPCSFQLSHSFSATIPWERSRCSVAVKSY